MLVSTVGFLHQSTRGRAYRPFRGKTHCCFMMAVLSSRTGQDRTGPQDSAPCGQSAWHELILSENPPVITVSVCFHSFPLLGGVGNMPSPESSVIVGQGDDSKQVDVFCSRLLILKPQLTGNVLVNVLVLLTRTPHRGS